MNKRIAEILIGIQKLESDLEVEMARHRLQFAYTIENDKTRFEDHVLTYHKRLRSNWLKYLLEARPVVLISAPIIYSTIVAFFFLDISVSLYQRLCFRVYGIPRVLRRDHFVYDRGHLAYLNRFEQFNCLFCSYGNGVVSYAREIAARTEQYWCPIKHARRIVGEHERCRSFADYGDAKAYQADLKQSRAKLNL
jgi:hypothetical protein